MRLREYQLRNAWINNAVSGILSTLTSALDLGDKNLIQSASSILSGAQEDVIKAFQPGPALCPALRVGAGVEEYPIEAVMFHRTEGYFTLPLYFIYREQDEPNFEALRRSHIDMCLRALEQPTDDSPSGLDRNASIDWSFSIEPWKCKVDHDTPLKHLRYVPMLPPYYCSRVDLEIQINNVNYVS